MEAVYRLLREELSPHMIDWPRWEHMMQTRMTREEAQASRERWRIVQERQRSEEVRLTPDGRFRRLLLLMHARLRFEDPHRAAEEQTVHDRWQRLREILLA